VPAGGRSIDIWRFVRDDDLGWNRERLFVALADASCRTLDVREVPLEGLTAAALRKLFGAQSLAAAKVLVGVHHRPQGDDQPAATDVEIGERLASVASEMGMASVEHMTFCGGRHYFMADPKLV
jgi:DNA repair protein RadC